jgi:hypothetical protein
VITSEPTGSVVVVIVTVPLEAVIFPLPNVTPPLVIVIVPVGPFGTEAVIVTDWPKVLGPEVLTVSVGFAFATAWVVVATDVLKFASPLYAAESRSLPSGSEEVISVAIPPTRVDVPNVVEPVVNVTVPVALLGKVSVRVTGLPGSDGLGEETSVDAGVTLFTVWVVVPVAEL